MPESVDIFDVLELFGARCEWAGTWDEVAVFCPFCEDRDSRKPAGRANAIKDVYYCFVCGTGGSPRSLLDRFTTIELMEGE